MKTFKLILNLIIILTLFSCSKNENKSGISNDLYQEILKYQKENPIDESDAKFLGEKHFIYEVTILPPKYSNPEDENQSIFITMSVFGAGNEVKNHCYGVYENEDLQKTIIYDEANLIDKFVTLKRKESLEKYIVENPPVIDIIYPVKMYNIVNEKLVFINELPGNNHRK